MIGDPEWLDGCRSQNRGRERKNKANGNGRNKTGGDWLFANFAH